MANKLNLTVSEETAHFLNAAHTLATAKNAIITALTARYGDSQALDLWAEFSPLFDPIEDRIGRYVILTETEEARPASTERACNTECVRYAAGTCPFDNPANCPRFNEIYKGGK